MTENIGCGKYLCNHPKSTRCGENGLFCGACQPVCRFCDAPVDDDCIRDQYGYICDDCCDAMNERDSK